MSADSVAPLNRIDEDEQPMQAEHVTCEHWWVATVQPDFPDEVRSISRCGLCGYYNGADLAEQVGAALSATRAQVEAVRALIAPAAGMASVPFGDGERYFAESDIRAALGTADQPKTPATCKHGKTEPHRAGIHGLGMVQYDCPGPAAADQPPKGASEDE